MSTPSHSPYGEEYSQEQIEKPGEFRVRLGSAGNPDFGQDPSRPLYGAKRAGWKKVGSLKEASEACRFYINENGLGGGNWVGGDVQDSAGKVVARISYNGRVWHPAQ